MPKYPDKYAVKKLERQIRRHPGLATLEKPRIDDRQRDDALYNAPQLVTMGATLRNRLKGYLLVDSGWFTKQSGNLVRITETLRPTTLRK